MKVEKVVVAKQMPVLIAKGERSNVRIVYRGSDSVLIGGPQLLEADNITAGNFGYTLSSSQEQVLELYLEKDEEVYAWYQGTSTSVSVTVLHYTPSKVK